MYENKPEFPGGRGGGCKTKLKLFVGGVWIFSGTAQLQLKKDIIISQDFFDTCQNALMF